MHTFTLSPSHTFTPRVPIAHTTPDTSAPSATTTNPAASPSAEAEATGPAGGGTFPARARPPAGRPRPNRGRRRSWSPSSRRALASGMLGSSMSIGGAIGSAITGGMILAIGWRLTFVVYSIFGVVWAIGFYTWFRDQPQDHTSVKWTPGHDVPGDLSRLSCSQCVYIRQRCPRQPCGLRRCTRHSSSTPTPGRDGVSGAECASLRGQKQPVTRRTTL